MIGKTISHYQILEKLGEGGMGVVYKARDTHLDRFVALKILPTEKVADPDRRLRFVQEAKAASALNHPHIVTIYDIDEADGVHFIAMEYVDGKTLDQLIPRHGMRLNEALKVAVQMADALAAAHEAGIVHRDLKPGNLMVTEKGQVKVLDFGLAKLTEKLPTGAEDATLTAKPDTEEGKILGTVAYMSPEQAEGKKVDARSDIFSFGSVFYEMVTGRRAFQGNTPASTQAAILKENPKPASQVVEALPKEVERLISRCLRKDVHQRFQHMDDLKVALEELKQESDSGTLETSSSVATKRRPYMVFGSIIITSLALAAAAWYWFGRPSPAPSEGSLAAVPLTSYSGSESSPSFSPDGSQVAFSWNGEKEDNDDIYVKVIGTEPPLRLTTSPARDYSPRWSPDGRWIAFCRDLPASKVAVILIPPIGGSERKLTETNSRDPLIDGPFLTWTPDSRSLVIIDSEGTNNPSLFLFSVETREKRKLTSPPAKSMGDSCPAFSPDGHTLAFSRYSESANSSLHLQALSNNLTPVGEAKPLTPISGTATSPVWTLDGNEIIFCSLSGIGSGLWRMAVSKPAKPQRLAFAGDQAFGPAVSRQGNRLAYAVGRYDWNIWRVDLHGPGGKPGNPVRFISSSQWDGMPAYSLDGKRIAFVSDRSGTSEIWTCDSDGSKQIKLTSFGGPWVFGPKWSPDSQNIAVCANPGGNQDVYVIAANGGTPLRLTTDPALDHWPSWSKDGQWLYFSSTRKGGEIWKIPFKGGEAIQVTKDDGADLPLESPDGKWLFYSKGWPGPQSVLRMPVGGGEITKVLDAVHPTGWWTMGKNGIYFFTVPDEKRNTDISLYEFDTGKTSKIRRIERQGENIAVSPDGRTILYSQLDEASSDLMLVENFR